MSDEVYHAADGNINRPYYLQTPSLESHVLALAVPDGYEPVAPHVVGAPQHVPPPVQGGVALPPPTAAPPPPPTLNLQSMAFAGNDVQNLHAMAMDVQGQYGFPADGARAAVPAVLDAPPCFEPTLEHTPELGSMSLYDHNISMDVDDGDDGIDFDALIKSLEDAGINVSAAVGEQAVSPVEEGLSLVPFVPGQLDCSMCRPVREVLHESENHKLYFVVHMGGPTGTFQHAIIDRANIDAGGQILLNEVMYADLRERTHECVQHFIARSVEMLKNNTSGQLTDLGSSTSQPNNAMLHRELEMEMLKEILSTPSPAILESSQVSVQKGKRSSSSDASATGSETRLAKQRRRISQMTMKDIANLLHMNMKDAAKELNISFTSLKRLCRKHMADRWPARKISSLDKRIKRLKEDALTNAGTLGLLAIEEKINNLNKEKEKVYASVLMAIEEMQKHNDGAGSSRG